MSIHLLTPEEGFRGLKLVTSFHQLFTTCLSIYRLSDRRQPQTVAFLRDVCYLRVDLGSRNVGQATQSSSPRTSCRVFNHFHRVLCGQRLREEMKIRPHTFRWGWRKLCEVKRGLHKNRGTRETTLTAGPECLLATPMPASEAEHEQPRERQCK